jgi:hypothetical protein
MSDGELKFPEWQGPLKEVLLEFDPQELPEKLQKVESLILERLLQLSQAGDSDLEKEAILDALTALRVVKQPKLGNGEIK